MAGPGLGIMAVSSGGSNDGTPHVTCATWKYCFKLHQISKSETPTSDTLDLKHATVLKISSKHGILTAVSGPEEARRGGCR